MAVDETATQKVQKVTRELLRTLSFKSIRLKETADADVVGKGGAMTKGNEISFDPRYALRASEQVLALVLAHEHWHAKHEPSNDEFALRMQHLADIVDYVGTIDPQKTSLEEFEKVAFRFVQKELEWDADDYAVWRLFDCGWSLSQAKEAVMDWRLHQEWYTREIVQNPSLVDDVMETGERLLRRCQEIWDERESS